MLSLIVYMHMKVYLLYGNLILIYRGYGDEDHEGLEGDKSSGGIKLSLNRCFYDERWTKNRVITSMDWSTVFPELLVHFST